MPPASALAHRLAVICQALACWPQGHHGHPQRTWRMSCHLGNRPKHSVPDTRPDTAQTSSHRIQGFLLFHKASPTPGRRCVQLLALLQRQQRRLSSSWVRRNNLENTSQAFVQALLDWGAVQRMFLLWGHVQCYEDS